MLAIKGMEEKPTDCKKCPLMGVKGNPTDPIFASSPMMCVPIWATSHEVKYCIGGKIRDDCPLTEIVTCKDCKYTKQNEDNDRYCDLSGRYYDPDYFCANGERRE